LTALVQAGLGGIVLAIAGVPFAGLLAPSRSGWFKTTLRVIVSCISWNAQTGPVFSGGGHVRRLTVVRSVQARRMKLVVKPRHAGVRLTIPRRAGLVEAYRWAETKRDWIEAQLAAFPSPQPIEPGMNIPLAGTMITLEWDESFPRKPCRVRASLRIGGPRVGLDLRLLRWLKAEARDLQCFLGGREGIPRPQPPRDVVCTVAQVSESQRVDRSSSRSRG